VERARIIAVGTDVPAQSYTQSEVLDLLGITDPRIRSIYLNAAIDRRHLILPPTGPDGNRTIETQGQLLRKHVHSGLELGAAAVEACLKQAKAAVDDVRYLCCVSSTGFLTPGLSARLLADLGLRPDCARLDVVGMGCNAGLNALNAVTAWARTHPGELAVMVCIEVCSAAYAVDGSIRTGVVNSLFGDGAAAVAILADPGADGSSLPGPEILGSASHIIPDSLDAMRYDWDDEQSRFSFYLDPEVPYLVGAHAPEPLRRLLADAGLRRSDINHWIVHSGGKKVIDSVRVNLGLTRHDVRHTIGVLRDYGNLSSGSFLFSYERLLADETVNPGDYAVMMTMGPGSTIEMVLLRWSSRLTPVV
jgi:polyketide synthase Type III